MTDDTTTTPVAASISEEAQQQLVTELVARVHAEGGDLVGPDGLLTEVTKRVLETGLEVEMSEHLGYDKHAVEGRNRGNSRNGTRSKTVLTDVGAGTGVWSHDMVHRCLATW